MNPLLYGSIVSVVLKILFNILFVFVCMSIYTHTRYVLSRIHPAKEGVPLLRRRAQHCGLLR